ncbi:MULTISPECIES: S-layer glycoprotein N-glycosyltransferase AglJ [Haloarcula]|uniref:Glycosyltransferase, TIGR04182 family n=1 Tax=Haloarcula pellucida TaxID=1427151 RepID=A0A830GI34_9EURY|nr:MULTISPECIES: S-layer glycoprotein N-glycosyltransferase AglJ [Halomicroarcula]MBX0347317.1 S-layer glycoprotein N-glycosyltransferase AglJ [Halomicroarcula pellucida]MDS0276808.1 S-layer glycoprotein N-glycosyltransferase AglJ [Halomicroarcula sp. S1AR25-4]GGN88072.1 glycosyltransferase, TIGR04182 family [Halomicroarcula pellucida]
MADRDDVCVLLPAYNEAETIESVVRGFRDQGFDNVLVIDGGSTDGTRDLATEAGARIAEQRGSGKGQAVREAVSRHVDAEFVLMADADETYRPDEADRMLEPLFEGRAEHVIGNRFADMQPGAMTRLNQVGNKVINWAFSVIHGHYLTDILSGYRAFTRESFERLSLSSEGFGIETEMAVECVKHGVRTEVVPITYEPRPDESETNLRPFRDGGTIIVTLYRMAKTNNPLFYFGSVGFGTIGVGVALGAFVVYDWVVNSISHEVIAMVGGVAIILGIQLLMFGVLSDMIVTVNREQTRRLEDIAHRLGGQQPPAAGVETDDSVGNAPAEDDAETTVSARDRQS